MPGVKDIATGNGTIAYNGHTFGPLRKSRIVGVAEYDEAERMVKYIRYTLTVHAIIYASSVPNEDQAMESLQNDLMEPGRQLIIEDIGFDNSVDTGGTTPDMFWGAKPRMIHWVTIGHVAAEVIWEVEFNISRCASAGQVTANPFMAFNWDATYSINDHGLTTRTISGYAEVPGYRGTAGSRALLFNVDTKWDRIIVKVPTGFRRTNNVRKINFAKNRIDFSFTDSQLEGEAFPAGIVAADLSYTFSNTVKHSFIQWLATLSGPLTVAPDQPNARAGGAFFAILADKVAKVRQGARGPVLPLQLTVGHKLFTRTSHFACTFMVTTCLREILSASGIWSPVPGSDWGTWSASMVNVWDNRGHARLKFNAADDRLVDACVSYSQATLGTEGSQAGITRGQFSQTLFCEVNKENSYITYTNGVQGVGEHSAIIHKFAQQYQPGQSSYREHEVQYQGAPDLYVIMTGEAKRIKYKPEVPELVSVGGAQAQFLAENIYLPDTPESRLFDCPIYYGQWSRLYRLARNPLNESQAYRQDRPDSCK